MTPDERARRGVKFKQMLEDPEVQEAFASIEADLKEEWVACHNADERLNLWLSVRLIEKLKTWMISAASYDLTALRRLK